MSDFEQETDETEVVVDDTAPPMVQPGHPEHEEGSITSASFQENQRALETIRRLKDEML